MQETGQLYWSFGEAVGHAKALSGEDFCLRGGPSGRLFHAHRGEARRTRGPIDRFRTGGATGVHPRSVSKSAMYSTSASTAASGTAL